MRGVSLVLVHYFYAVLCCSTETSCTEAFFLLIFTLLRGKINLFPIFFSKCRHGAVLSGRGKGQPRPREPDDRERTRYTPPTWFFTEFYRDCLDGKISFMLELYRYPWRHWIDR